MTNQEILRCMKEFTAAYKSTDDIFLREAYCLKVQFSYSFSAAREGDIVVGRRFNLPLGFWPQSMTVGYNCDFEILEKMKSETAELSDEIDKLIDFWKNEVTVAKLQERYDDEIKNNLTFDDYNIYPGTAFPLYRMGGAQMDPTFLLENGIDGIIELAKEKRGKNPSYYDAVVIVMKALSELCVRYANEVKDNKIRDNLLFISKNPPETFLQAIQLTHLFFICSGTFNCGRMDEYLGDYFCADIDSGRITFEDAVEILMSQWRLYAETGQKWDWRVCLGGKGRRNPENADRFAFAAIEATKRNHDILPQLTLRFYKGMNDELYDKALDCIASGATFPMLYNDDVNIPAVQNAFGVDEKTAELYIPFGCGEYVIYNRSFGTPNGAFNLLYCLNEEIEESLSSASGFDEFYNNYLNRIKRYAGSLAKFEKLQYDVCAESAPFLFFSILFGDCFEKAQGTFSLGLDIGGTLECYGIINSADSLTSIKELVFDTEKISADELILALRADFEGYDEIRKLCLDAPKYGNDNAEDIIAVRFNDDLCEIVKSQAKRVGLKTYLVVNINNSMNTTFGLTTPASADGRRANTYLANGNNPTGGADKSGLTAMLNSLVKLKVDNHAGSVQNMRFSKEMFSTLLPKTKCLLDTYFENGGSQSMITVLSRGDLERAMAEPEKYQNLIVRVGGFSARFVELEKEVQQELLSRTLY